MPYLSNDWRPGSFTRNFAWGTEPPGLKKLKSAISLGFNNELKDVPRGLFRNRISSIATRDQQLIPLNFFLFNYIDGNESIILTDELVYQAIQSSYTVDFDRLAVFALNLSHAGQWIGSEPFQKYPAEWARNFIVERVAAGGSWDKSQLQAPQIQSYLDSHPNYHASTDYKLSRNLAKIFELGNMHTYHTGANATWWSSAAFLALDRMCADRFIPSVGLTSSIAIDLLDEIDFWKLTGVEEVNGKIAADPVVKLYIDCGGRERFVATLPTSVISPVEALKELEKEKSETPVMRVYTSASRQVRNSKIIRTIRALYSDKCSVCGFALPIQDHQTYCEVGHIKPVGKPINGPDHISNVLPFCPNHHKTFDRGGLFFLVSGSDITVRTRYGDTKLDNRPMIPHPHHGLDSTYLDWHRKYFE